MPGPSNHLNKHVCASAYTHHRHMQLWMGWDGKNQRLAPGGRNTFADPTHGEHFSIWVWTGYDGGARRANSRVPGSHRPDSTDGAPREEVAAEDAAGICANTNNEVAEVRAGGPVCESWVRGVLSAGRHSSGCLAGAIALHFVPNLSSDTKRTIRTTHCSPVVKTQLSFLWI
uniref:Uncharacterized protein n=1 Tax=Knipowitschia caucasica TaxID=637954 RepID=A0AAV2JWK9_KNICA